MMPARPWEIAVGALLRLGLGALFIVAGVLKLRDPAAFAVEITNYRFLAELAPYVAVTLPAIEIVVGLAIVVAPVAWRASAALAALAMLAVFTVAVAQARARGINVDCGCFGGASGPVTGWTIARDVGLMLAAAMLYAITAPNVRATNR
jgi:putative oxidoreductase